MKTKMLGLGMIALIAAVLVAVPARATSLKADFDFSGGAGGKLSFTTAMGNDLSITNALITGLAVPGGKPITVTDGSMDFTTAGCKTGCFANALAGGGYSTMATFNYGGLLTLVGELPGMTSGPVTLLMGTFSPLGLNGAGKPGSAGPFASLNSKTHSGGFNGSLDITTINPLVYTAFLPLMFQTPSGSGKSYESQMWIDLSFVTTTPVVNHKTTGTWNGTVGSTDILVKPVPEPSGLLLLGSALVAMAGFLRRKVKLVI
jgi:hypothetical protein